MDIGVDVPGGRLAGPKLVGVQSQQRAAATRLIAVDRLLPARKTTLQLWQRFQIDELASLVQLNPVSSQTVRRQRSSGLAPLPQRLDRLPRRIFVALIYSIPVTMEPGRNRAAEHPHRRSPRGAPAALVGAESVGRRVRVELVADS